MSEHDKTVTVHIDRKPYESARKTTGAALYALGGVNPTTYTLYEEEKSDTEDQAVANDASAIEVKNGQHYYSAEKSLNPGSSRWM